MNLQSKLLLTLAAGTVFLVVMGSCQYRRAEKLRFQSANQDSLIVSLKSEIGEKDRAIDMLRFDLDKREAELREKKIVYVSKKIPPPVDPPANDEKLAGELLTFGLAAQPLVYTADAPSVIYRKDAEVIHGWAYRSKVILPATEDKLAAADEVIKASLGEINVLRDLDSKNQERHSLDQKQVAALETKASITTKALEAERAQRWKKWGYGIAGAAIGYVIAR